MATEFEFSRSFEKQKRSSRRKRSFLAKELQSNLYRQRIKGTSGYKRINDRDLILNELAQQEDEEDNGYIGSDPREDSSGDDPV